MEWCRFVLSVEDKLPFLDQPIPVMPVSPAGQVLPSDVLNTHIAWVKASKKIAGLMLMTMDPDIQKNLEHLGAYDMLKKLKTLYAQQADHKLLQTVREFHACKQEEGQPVSSYVLKMKSYIDNLEHLGHAMTQNLSVSLILVSLRKEYDDFVQNYNMHSMGKTVTELHAMLKLHEQTFPPKEAAPSFINKRAKLNLDSALLWHCRLGHISKKCIEKLQHDGLLDSTDIKSFEKYVSCMCEKMERKPYSHQVERAKDILGLIHTDSGYVYLLKHKHEVFETFKVFQKEVENQLEKTIKSLCFDYGGKYTSQDFLDHLKENGINSHQTPLYTPQHNSVSNKRNKTLLDMVRSMMSQTTLLKSFWDYAIESVACILNMVPTKKRDTLTKPDKLEPKSIKYIFIGYPKETMGYSFYYPPENKVFVAQNAEFLENSLIAQEASGTLEDLKIIQEEDMHPSLDTSFNHEEDDQEIDEPQRDLGEPANYKAALLDPESDKWLNAMNVDMQSMRDNEVWKLVDFPLNCKTVGHKWLFKKKTDMDGAVHTYKARLVAKGFTQTLGIDYEETFSPVADIRAIRILIAITAFYDYEIWQRDVKTAFLNGYLNEEVKDNKEKDKIRAKPNKIKSKRKAWESLESSLTKSKPRKHQTLILKIPDTKMVKDFRPISLIGSLYKIIAKILANRLVTVLGDVINEIQSAFAADRQILDEDVLKKFGFGEKWCKWIRECLRSSWGSVIVNGSPTEEFQFFKGLKQGDLLSSFQNVVDAGMFKGIVLNSSMVLSHMASGLRMNMSKSKIMGIGVNGDKVDQVAHRIGCGILEVPFTYFGSKVGGCMSRIQN
uniref:Integrase catalytic domain-containing protein n=1 Tax=Tanacetum cinerariifolium TaxID=118510 RepID=A0A6L2MC38_TANCI|nr:hypothetical protein [Tanacetum cinerariifolium]